MLVLFHNWLLSSCYASMYAHLSFVITLIGLYYGIELFATSSAMRLLMFNRTYL